MVLIRMARTGPAAQFRRAIGTALTALRIERGFSAEAVADALGISARSYAQLEAGWRDLAFGQGMVLADIFGVTLDCMALASGVRPLRRADQPPQATPGPTAEAATQLADEAPPAVGQRTIHHWITRDRIPAELVRRGRSGRLFVAESAVHESSGEANELERAT